MSGQAVIHPFDLLLDIDKRNHALTTDASAQAKPVGEEGRLAVRLGSWNLLLPMDDVAEIVPIPRITRIPGVATWLLGIANLRGTILSVVDLQEFLGGEPSTPTPNSRLVVARSGEWEYGLLIHEVIGMRQFGEQSRLPDMAENNNFSPYFSEGFEGENRHWFVFNIDRLLNDPKFLDAAI
ncbi:MAG: chemotaxis protein CheW [Candidatus Competibacteraceae bacterium]|nr:chemotaxis protein CheW [Candidatus Competibacteraceae bacterium]